MSCELLSKFLGCLISGCGFGKKKNNLMQKYLKEHKIEVSLKITCPFFTEMEKRETNVTNFNSILFDFLV